MRKYSIKYLPLRVETYIHSMLEVVNTEDRSRIQSTK